MESAKVKMRKPEPRIYQYTLDQLELEASDAIFIDDLGMNLKHPKAMGMRTIRVRETTLANSIKRRKRKIQTEKYVHVCVVI